MSERLRLADERGSTLAELPLAMLWVFLVIFGLTESARLVLAYSTLAQSARAGTRYAIVHGIYRTGSCTPDIPDGSYGMAGPEDDPPCVVAEAMRITTAAGLSSASVNVKVRYPDGTNKIGAPVTVTVTYPFKSVLPLLTPFGVTIGSTSQGRICY